MSRRILALWFDFMAFARPVGPDLIYAVLIHKTHTKLESKQRTTEICTIMTDITEFQEQRKDHQLMQVWQCGAEDKEKTLYQQQKAETRLEYKVPWEPRSGYTYYRLTVCENEMRDIDPSLKH